MTTSTSLPSLRSSSSSSSQDVFAKLKVPDSIDRQELKKWFQFHVQQWYQVGAAFAVLFGYHAIIEPWMFEESCAFSGFFLNLFVLILTLVAPYFVFSYLPDTRVSKLEFQHYCLGLAHCWILADGISILFQVTLSLNAVINSILFASAVFVSLFVEEKWRYRRDYQKWISLPVPISIAFLITISRMVYYRYGIMSAIFGTIVGSMSAFLMFSYFTMSCPMCLKSRATKKTPPTS